MEGYILRKQHINALSGEHKTHFLNDNAKRINLSLGDLPASEYGWRISTVNRLIIATN